MDINEINTRVAKAFQVNIQAKALQDIFADIMLQMTQNLQKESTPKIEKIPNMVFKMHKPSICKRTGRIARDKTCVCQG